MLKKTSSFRQAHRAVSSRHPTRSLKPINATQPEHLVGMGFRSWMLGYQTGEISCWEKGWSLFSNELGADNAKNCITELACWVRNVQSMAQREINVYPLGCAGFCQDECMAISLIAASQHDQCPALKACAFALLGNNSVDEMISSAESFSSTLTANGITLGNNAIINAAATIETGTQVQTAH